MQRELLGAKQKWGSIATFVDSCNILW
jgi:hypothetical protein